jgi:predicted transcriptional regulator
LWGWGALFSFGHLIPISLSLFEKRDRVLIIMDILETLKDKHEGKRKTNIMQSANLSTEQVRKYLELLYINGLVSKYGDVYRVTRKGVEFLEIFEMMNLRLK